MVSQRTSRTFLVSLPERVFRAAAALLGGSIHETGALVLPRLVRRSKLYEATAANLLRITVELVGGVEGAPTEREDGVGKIAVRKGAGNVVELGSIAAFGFSPLWLLAGASDVLRGSGVYLGALVEELQRARLVGDDLDVSSVDELLEALERGSGRTAGLIDIPPVELKVSARRSRSFEPTPQACLLPPSWRASSKPSAEPRSPNSGHCSRCPLASALPSSPAPGAFHGNTWVIPYWEDWQPLRREGFARLCAPRLRAVSPRRRRALRPCARHLDVPGRGEFGSTGAGDQRDRPSPPARSRGGNHVSPASPLLRVQRGGTSRFPAATPHAHRPEVGL